MSRGSWVDTFGNIEQFWKHLLESVENIYFCNDSLTKDNSSTVEPVSAALRSDLSLSCLLLSDGPGHLQRAAGGRGPVRAAVRGERAQRRCGRGSVLVSLQPAQSHESQKCLVCLQQVCLCIFREKKGKSTGAEQNSEAQLQSGEHDRAVACNIYQSHPEVQNWSKLLWREEESMPLMLSSPKTTPLTLRDEIFTFNAKLSFSNANQVLQDLVWKWISKNWLMYV